MKKEINAEDIRTGDTIRLEYLSDKGTPRAVEYVAEVDGTEEHGGVPYKLFLLSRPRPWGMVIGDPRQASQRAVYIPHHQRDATPWLTQDGWEPNRRTA